MMCVQKWAKNGSFECAREMTSSKRFFFVLRISLWNLENPKSQDEVRATTRTLPEKRLLDALKE